MQQPCRCGLTGFWGLGKSVRTPNLSFRGQRRLVPTQAQALGLPAGSINSFQASHHFFGFFLPRLQQHGRGSHDHLRGALRASQLCSRTNVSRCPASSSSAPQIRMRARLQAGSSGSSYAASRSAQSATGSGVYDPRKKVVVVGGGWAGFGAAKHLAEQGYAVTLLEAAKNPGGLSGGECVVIDGAQAAGVR